MKKLKHFVTSNPQIQIRQRLPVDHTGERYKSGHVQNVTFLMSANTNRLSMRDRQEDGKLTQHSPFPTLKEHGYL